MKQTDNYSVNQDIAEYLRYLVRLRVRTGNLMYRYQHQNGGLDDFRDALAMLYEKYFNKFHRRTDVERPDWAVEEMLGQEHPVDVHELNFEQCKALYYAVSELQEKLGHTSIETREWADTEGVGGKQEAKEIKKKIEGDN